MSATRMPTGRWRVTIGHHHRRHEYFDTWEEASAVLEQEKMDARFRDSQKGKNRKGDSEKTEKVKTEKVKTEKVKTEKVKHEK